MKHVALGFGAALVAVVVAVVLNFVGVFAFTSMDGRQVASSIADDLRASGTSASVVCPRAIPKKKGGIEECEANTGYGSTTVRVTQDDSQGHYSYQIGDVKALAPKAVIADPPADVESARFLQDCYNAEGSYSYCRCLLEGMATSHTPAEAALIEDDIRDGDPVSRRATADLMATCGRS